MILFQDFIEALNYAVLLANDHIMGKQDELLDTYFIQPTPEEGEEIDPNTPWEAKAVTIKYPTTKDGGVVLVDVEVPLITLVPMAFTQVEKVTMNIDFDIQVVDSKLSIGFDRPAAGRSGRSVLKEKSASSAHNSELEVVIVPQESTEGLKRLIEGYEKSLRAQIP